MFRNAFLAASALALLGCAEPQPKPPQPVRVSNVEVVVDVAAIATRQAANRWATLEDDIVGALVQEFVGMTSTEGYLVKVDIDELSLAALSDQALDPNRQARLTGRVEMVDILSGKVVRSFAVSASSNQAAAFLPPGSDARTVSPSSQAFYEGVVRAFARGVAEVVRRGPDSPA